MQEDEKIIQFIHDIPLHEYGYEAILTDKGNIYQRERLPELVEGTKGTFTMVWEEWKLKNIQICQTKNIKQQN